MIKVSCIGDSIRMQYAPVVRDMLGEGFVVYEPAENCRFAKYTLRGLFDWAPDMNGSSIVHWNNGLWDVCDLFGDGAFSSEEEYISNMLRIADLLLARYEVVIFATTTPVSPKNIYNKNEMIIQYNEKLVPLLKERGIVINDLHSVVYRDIDRYISDDNIHLSEEGIRLCADAVTKVILDAASRLKHTPAASCEGAEIVEGAGAPVLFA